MTKCRCGHYKYEHGDLTGWCFRVIDVKLGEGCDCMKFKKKQVKLGRKFK